MHLAKGGFGGWLEFSIQTEQKRNGNSLLGTGHCFLIDTRAASDAFVVHNTMPLFLSFFHQVEPTWCDQSRTIFKQLRALEKQTTGSGLLHIRKY